MNARLAACTFALFLLFRSVSLAADPNGCDTRIAPDPVLRGKAPDAVVYAEAGGSGGPGEPQRGGPGPASGEQAAFLAALLLQAQPGPLADAKRCETHTKADPLLCIHEPTTVGITKDSDDSGFLDFKLSVQYQLLPQGVTNFLRLLHDTFPIPISGYPAYNSAVYFAFTGRFGQYLNTRDSSPVVGKRFNPKLFYRIWTDKGHEGYFDLTFLAHESNGQSIDSPAEYQAARSALAKPEIVDDQLSRGWDYIELVWKHSLKQVRDQRTFSSYVTLKHFLANGIMQKGAEEYNEWEENPEGKPRTYVNGFAGMLKFQGQGEWFTLFDTVILKDVKAVFAYETGTRRPFRYSTTRLEFGTKVLQLPLTVWRQHGYNSDLAQYFKRVESYGIQLEIGSF